MLLQAERAPAIPHSEARPLAAWTHVAILGPDGRLLDRQSPGHAWGADGLRNAWFFRTEAEADHWWSSQSAGFRRELEAGGWRPAVLVIRAYHLAGPGSMAPDAGGQPAGPGADCDAAAAGMVADA